MGKKQTTAPDGTAIRFALWRALHLSSELKIKWIIVSTFVFLAAWMLLFTHLYSVNLFYYDIWDLYQPSMEHKTWWELFSMQFGSQRVGLGILVSQWLMSVSGWNARAESFAVALALISCAGVALRLKWVLFQKWSPWDILLLSHMLCLASWECIVGSPFLAFTSIPLLLILLTASSLLIGNVTQRLVVVCAESILLLFSSQSILAIPPIVFLLGFDLIFSSSKKNRMKTVATLLLICCAISFLVTGHHMEVVGTDCFSRVQLAPIDYLLFVGAYFMSLFGWYMHLPGLPVIGLGIFVLLILLWFSLVRQLLSKDSKRITPVLFFLLTFTLIHACAAAYGRTCLGTRAAHTSRYFPYMMPAFVVAYFWVSEEISSKIKPWLLSVMLGSHLVLQIFLYGHQLPKVVKELKSRELVKDCLVAGKTIRECQVRVNYKIHPSIEEAGISEKIEYLRQHRLGPFFIGLKILMN